MNFYFDKLIKGLKSPIKAILYIIGKGYQKDKVESSLINNSPVNLVVHVGEHLAQEVEFYRSLGVERMIWIEADPSIKKPTALMKEKWLSLSVIGNPLKQITSRLDTILASIDLSTYKRKNNLLVLDI